MLKSAHEHQSSLHARLLDCSRRMGMQSIARTVNNGSTAKSIKTVVSNKWLNYNNRKEHHFTKLFSMTYDFVQRLKEHRTMLLVPRIHTD